jgi:hypothetical protein
VKVEAGDVRGDREGGRDSSSFARVTALLIINITIIPTTLLLIIFHFSFIS